MARTSQAPSRFDANGPGRLLSLRAFFNERDLAGATTEGACIVFGPITSIRSARTAASSVSLPNSVGLNLAVTL